MKKELLDALAFKARNIGLSVAKKRLGHDWANWNTRQDLIQRIYASDDIEFVVPGGWAGVRLSNIRPAKATVIEYDPPKPGKKIIADLNKSVIKNDSDTITIERSYTYKEDETTTMQQEAGVAVGIEIRQLIGYGGELANVKGETEITARIDSHYSKIWGSESSVGREISNTIEVPPKTEVTIITQKSTEDFKQVGRCWCDIDYNIHIWSHGDYDVHFSSVHDFYMSAIGYGKHGHRLTNSFRDKPLTSTELANAVYCPPMLLETTLEFSNASSGNIQLIEKKL